MEIKINETGAIETLELTHKGSGCTEDFIGNWGGLNAEQINYDDEADCYTASQDTYSWWADAVAKQQRINDYVADYEGDEDLDQMLQDAAAGLGDDLESMLDAQIAVIESL